MIIVKTTEGDVGILPGHIDYMAAIDIGNLRVKRNGQWREATAHEGFIRVDDDEVTVVLTTCEWAEEIDLQRALEAKAKAQAMLDRNELEMGSYRMKKALNRVNIADE
jgi:F-type H+-transporting ATPase subunit epsilon